MDDAELLNRFSHHPPTPEQLELYKVIRHSCFRLARIIRKVCPDSRERATALTNLDQVMFNANAAIARRQATTRPGPPSETKFTKGDFVVFNAGDYAGEVVGIGGGLVTYCDDNGKEYVTGAGNLKLHPNNAFMRTPPS